jgi:hypothetical protein
VRPHSRQNRLKTTVFNALRLFHAILKQLPQNHWLILNNLFAQFGTFPGANPQIQIAQKVRPSDIRNPQSEHLAQNATLQANISRSRRTLAGVHFARQTAGHFQFCADSMSA